MATGWSHQASGSVPGGQTPTLDIIHKFGPDHKLVIVGDAKQFLDGLKEIRPNVEVIAASDLDLSSATLKKAAAE